MDGATAEYKLAVGGRCRRLESKSTPPYLPPLDKDKQSTPLVDFWLVLTGYPTQLSS